MSGQRQQNPQQNDNAVMQSVGRQFVKMSVETEQLTQRISQLEQIANQIAQENHELKCKLSKHEDVEGYKDGEQSKGDEESKPPKKRGPKAVK